MGLSGDLTAEHLRVIDFLRGKFGETGICPTVFQASRQTGFKMRDLERLFPAGYQRGACRMSGLPYLSCRIPSEPEDTSPKHHGINEELLSYRVDLHGFLIDPEEWDELYARHKAIELGIAGGLGDRHWQVIRFLRERFGARGAVPTIFETCRGNNLELDELERLFPSGYHRGAVKIAGLRLTAPRA
jgi:tRNA 2-thiouridine synthesizing protein E